MEKRSFYAPDIDLYTLGQALNDWFTGQSYLTQLLSTESGAVTVQARKEDAFRTFTGMSSALTAVITGDGENIAVEIGNAKWTDKAAVGAVGVILFPPALITAGIGAFQQSQLQSNAWKFIDQFIRSHSAFAGTLPTPGFPQTAAQIPLMRPQAAPTARPNTPPPPLNLSGVSTAGSGSAAASLCVSCHQPLRAGAKFCDNCGAPAPVSHNCRSCGKPLRPGARFCDECGAATGS